MSYQTSVKRNLLRQFLKLFFVTFGAVIIAALVLDLVHDQDSQASHQINISVLIDSIEDQKPLYQLVELKSLSWPSELLAKVKRGELVSLENSLGEVYHYKRLADNQIIKLGPIAVQPFQDSDYLMFIFYLALLVVLFASFWIIFRDLVTLIDKTSEFSLRKKPIKSGITKHSIIFPFAQNIERMSEQITRFLDLQKLLTSSISHDIRTPVGRALFINEMTETENLDESKKLIEDNLTEIDKLTDQFISLIKIESADGKLCLSTILLADLVAEIIDNYQYLSETQIEMSADSKVYVQADPLYLSRAIVNLIDNAIKHCNQRIKLCIKRNEECAQISISDDGKGIPKDRINTITKLYQQGNTLSTLEGYGIGLAFVQVVTDWHKGTLTIANSQSLGGAKISISIPVYEHINNAHSQ